MTAKAAVLLRQHVEGTMLAAVTINNDFYAGWGTLSLVNAGIAQG